MPPVTRDGHFDWLVDGRSRNQQATLRFYKVIQGNRNLTGDVEDQLGDAAKFLESLIAHNTVLYQTDFASREWSFGYYLDNALYRLSRLPEDVLPWSEQPVGAGSAKEQWTAAQAALEAAITNFTSMIEGR